MKPLSRLDDMLLKFMVHSNTITLLIFATLSKVFEAILSQGHHLLCRAKSNAVFYQIPPTPKKQKRGRPVRYGNRINLSRLQFEVEAVLRTLGIHWYKPKYITRGLMVAYLQKQIQQQGFSTSYDPTQNSQKNTKILEN